MDAELCKVNSIIYFQTVINNALKFNVLLVDIHFIQCIIYS
jgi:hypothetical protein